MPESAKGPSAMLEPSGARLHRPGPAKNIRYGHVNTTSRVGQSESHRPVITTAQERYIRDCRDMFEEYGRQTGDRRALAAAEALTFALIEGGGAGHD